jgi:glycosyltransferase involved in cell wall biosynthesis
MSARQVAVTTNTQPVKLTVGIPTFNRAGWLRESIESVLAQTFADFRLIVSDNASEDDTPEVVRSFDDDRIHYVRSQRNVGSIGNFNRLIALAETEFLVLLPDDDVLYPGHLAAAVDVLERFDTVGLVHSAFEFIDAQSRVVREVAPLVSRSPVKIDRRDRALEYLMVSDWGLCFPSVAYRTKAVLEAGGLREEEGPFGDRQLWMRIALDWSFGYIAKPLVGFRTHPDTITRSIGAEHGVTSDSRELYQVLTQTIFQQRMDFLDHSPLEPHRTKRLRALAKLQLLVRTAWGLSWSAATAGLANLVRTYPRIVVRPELWHLVVAQLGGRRVRSALRRPPTRRDQPKQG